MPINFNYETTPIGTYSNIGAIGTIATNCITASATSNCATASNYAEKPEEPVEIDVDKLVKEAEASDAYDCGGTIEIKTKTKVTIRKFIRPKAERDPYEVDHIVFGNPATVVHWTDGTKTVVKCAEGTEWNAYSAFCAALAKKIYKNNTKICEIVREKDSAAIENAKKAEKTRRKAERMEKEAKAHAKRIKRMAKRMREQEEAAEMAFGRTEKE